MQKDSDRYWDRIPLEQMSPQQWESLCDGCGRCCVHKLQDEETGEVYYTAVACRLLDVETCRCTAYERRHEEVPECVRLRPIDRDQLQWMPETCAYRLLAAGDPLPSWHPLISGRAGSVHERGISVRGRVIPEYAAGDPGETLFVLDDEDKASCRRSGGRRHAEPGEGKHGTQTN